MRLREKPIYLSNEVWRALWILAKADRSPRSEGDQGGVSVNQGVVFYSDARNTTPDEIADDLLRQAIREQHPDLTTRLEELDKLEKDLIEKLRKK